MAADDFSEGVDRGHFLVRHNREAIASQGHGPTGAHERKSAHAGGACPCRAFAELNDGEKLRILDDGVLLIGHLSVVLEKEPSARAGHSLGTWDAKDPMHDVQGM